MLGMRSRRRPVGYWDNTDNLDEVQHIPCSVQGSRVHPDFLHRTCEVLLILVGCCLRMC